MVDRAGSGVRRIMLNAKQETWRGENTLETALDTGFKCSVGTAVLVKLKHGLKIVCHQRPAVCTRRERRQYSSGARFFGRRVLRVAHEDFAAACRIVRHMWRAIGS